MVWQIACGCGETISVRAAEAGAVRMCPSCQNLIDIPPLDQLRSPGAEQPVDAELVGESGPELQSDDRSPRARQLVDWARRSPWQFGAAMVGLMFLLKLVSVPIFVVLPGRSTSEELLKFGLGAVLLSFLLLPLETLLGQWVPIEVLRLLRVRSWLWLVTVSAVLFGLLHLGAGAQGFMVGLTTGIPLALGYLAWRHRSIGYAIVATTLVHACHNGLALPIAWAAWSHEHRHVMQQQIDAEPIGPVVLSRKAAVGRALVSLESPRQSRRTIGSKGT